MRRVGCGVVSWLKRAFGTADAMEAVRERAGEQGGDDPAPASSATIRTAAGASSRPAGWGEVETSQEGDDLVIALPAPGLEEDSIHLEPDGSTLKLHAKGANSKGQQILLDETLKLPEGSDPSPATVSYKDDRLVVRIPKSALKPGG